jgi:hypothetical protein
VLVLVSLLVPVLVPVMVLVPVPVLVLVLARNRRDVPDSARLAGPGTARQLRRRTLMRGSTTNHRVSLEGLCCFLFAVLLTSL